MSNSLSSHAFARFWRCALQVNPSGYSKAYRGQEHGYTPETYAKALLDKCIELDIKVVGIADHGSVDDVDSLRAVLEPGGLVVFPGFEICSTEKIHMVCLYREGTTRDQLQRFLGALDLTDPGDGVRPSKLGCLDIASRVREQGGFWYAAHVTGNSGLLKLNKDGGGLNHIWRDDELVRVVQIPGPVEHLPENYRRIVEGREPAYARKRPIVLINAKDVAKPDDLAEPAATCLVKMTAPNFEAFKVAFLDPESRIRLNSAVPAHGHSALSSIKITGGYLDGIHIELSEHLNALIGGRGTGKSTFLEVLRYALDLKPKGTQALRVHQDIVKENLGKASGTIELVFTSNAQQGRRYRLTRRFGEPAIVRDEHDQISHLTVSELLPNLEIYGQNEIHELTQPEGRARLLERLLPREDDVVRRRAALVQSLGRNREKLVMAQDDLDRLRERVAQLPRLDEQLKGFREVGIEEKLAMSPLFDRERQLVRRIAEELNRVQEALGGLEEALPDLVFLSEDALSPLPNGGHFRRMRGELETLRQGLAGAIAGQKQSLEARRIALRTVRAEWESALAAREAELNKTLASLPEMAGKSGREVGTAYRQIAGEIERIRPLQAQLASQLQLSEALRTERENLIAELSELRSQRAAEVGRELKALNKRLDGKIRISLTPEQARGKLLSFLVLAKLDGVGERRLAWVETAEGLTPLSLVDAIRAGAETLRAQFGLTPGVAEALTKLSRDRLLALEELELDDLVSIELNVAHVGEAIFKSLERLSTGQQATAVLHMLLLDNRDPLIVDQPEDNLDNAFIADRIVRELRSAKSRRQFLFATHNANIPVFGDAEWIGVMSATDLQGTLGADDQGSIDVPTIRDRVATILEGGRAAFLQRKEKYDF